MNTTEGSCIFMPIFAVIILKGAIIMTIYTLLLTNIFIREKMEEINEKQ